MRELKRKVVNEGAKLRLNGEIWSVLTCLFADDTMLLAGVVRGKRGKGCGERKHKGRGWRQGEG